jgi:hypothetical protein
MRSSLSSVIQDRELLAEGEGLEVQGCPAPNRSSQGMEQGDEYGSHAAHVTLARAKKSTIPGLTAFLAGTGKQQTVFAGVHTIGVCDGGPQLNLPVLARVAHRHPLFLTEFVPLPCWACWTSLTCSITTAAPLGRCGASCVKYPPSSPRKYTRGRL